MAAISGLKAEWAWSLPVVTTLASLLLVVTLAGALYFGRDILVPVALAILLSFVLVPAVRALRLAGCIGAGALVYAAVLAVLGLRPAHLRNTSPRGESR